MKTAKTVRTRRCLAAAAALVMMLALTGAGAEEATSIGLDLQGWKESGEIIPEIKPGTDKSTVERWGIVFLPEPYGTMNLEEEGKTFVTYQTDPDAVAFTLQGIRMKDAWFQFLNGQLVNIWMEPLFTHQRTVLEGALRNAMGTPVTSVLPTPSLRTVTLTWTRQGTGDPIYLRLSTDTTPTGPGAPPTGGVPVRVRLSVTYDIPGLFPAVDE